jgi:hypothetical protein
MEEEEGGSALSGISPPWGCVIAARVNGGPGDAGDVWTRVADVVDEVEAELDVLDASVDDRVVARIQASRGTLSATLQEALRRGLSATVRDALARLRSEAELPQELPPDLIELPRLCAGSRCELTDLSDTWLVAQEVFWDRFQVVAERTLEDTALCWDVVKAARVTFRGQAARVGHAELDPAHELPSRSEPDQARSGDAEVQDLLVDTGLAPRSS